MLRPRMIASPVVLDRTRGLIARDMVAGAEYRSLLERIEKIFSMPLLHLPDDKDLRPVDQPAPMPPPIAPPAAAAPPLPRPAGATPITFLRESFEQPPPAPRPSLPPGIMVPEALSFKQKGEDAYDVAKPGLCRLQALGLAWHLVSQPERERYARRGIAEMMALCNMSHWGNEHFLATATIMQALAIGYDWLHAAMSDQERADIRKALIDKGVVPSLAAFAAPQQPAWLRLPSNWSVVCNASLIMTALAIGPDTPDARVARLRDLASEAIKVGLRLFTREGAWRLEGPGYWHLAAEHLTYLLAAFETSGSDMAKLAEWPGIAETGTYRNYVAGPTTQLFNYGDCEEGRPGLWWLRWHADRYGLPHLHEMAEDRSGALGAAPEVHPMDLLWRRPTPVAGTQSAIGRLPTARNFGEFAVLRGPWGDPASAYVGIKAGETSGWRSHSHLDLGHFVYEAGGVRWAVDLGPGEYRDCYLTPPWRYSYYRASTSGHNTLVIDGVNQAYRPGDDKAQAIAAPISGPYRNGRGDEVRVDLAAAYPGLERLIRTFALDEGGALSIDDDIAPGPRARSVVWSMHTPAAVDCRGRAARLELPAPAGGRMLRLQAEILSPAGATFGCAAAGPAALYGACEEKEKAIEGLRRLEVALPALATPTRLRVRLGLLPDG